MAGPETSNEATPEPELAALDEAARAEAARFRRAARARLEAEDGPESGSIRPSGAPGPVASPDADGPAGTGRATPPPTPDDDAPPPPRPRPPVEQDEEPEDLSRTWRVRMVQQYYENRLPASLADRVARVEFDGGLQFGLTTGSVIHDTGRAIKLLRGDPNAAEIESMLDLARGHGWPSIDVHGSEEFKARMWLEAQRAGLAVTNYEPPDGLKAAWEAEQAWRARQPQGQGAADPADPAAPGTPQAPPPPAPPPVGGISPGAPPTDLAPAPPPSGPREPNAPTVPRDPVEPRAPSDGASGAALPALYVAPGVPAPTLQERLIDLTAHRQEELQARLQQLRDVARTPEGRKAMERVLAYAVAQLSQVQERLTSGPVPEGDLARSAGPLVAHRYGDATRTLRGGPVIDAEFPARPEQQDTPPVADPQPPARKRRHDLGMPM